MKEIANEHEGALVRVDQIKKGGCHRMIGSGLLDVFLRLGFLKVVSLNRKRCRHSSVFLTQPLYFIQARHALGKREAKVLLMDRTYFPLNLPFKMFRYMVSWYLVSGQQHIRFMSGSLRGTNISQKSSVFLLPICLPCLHSCAL